MERYIHYGADAFDPKKFLPIKNAVWGRNKPESGGLWASRTDAKFGWKDWCESEEFHLGRLRQKFTFTLSDDARVLHLFSVDDLKKIPKSKKTLFHASWIIPDFEKAMETYDAIELHLSEEVRDDPYADGLYYALYGWDCDSILIMNPDVIIPDGGDPHGTA